MTGSRLLILALAESAFAVFLVKSLTCKALCAFDLMRALVKVWDLLHKMFIVHMVT